MTTVLDGATQQVPINFADTRRGRNTGLWTWHDEDGFGIWSCRFSADGNEVVAGGSGKIFGTPTPSHVGALFSFSDSI